MSVNSIESLRKKEGLLTDKSNEFAKLNQADKLVCLDIIDRNREDLGAWIAYTSKYYKASGIEINIDKFQEEISRFEEYASMMDYLSKE